MRKLQPLKSREGSRTQIKQTIKHYKKPIVEHSKKFFVCYFVAIRVQR
jgi:hypothetical protein